MSGFVYFITAEAALHRADEDLRVVKIGHTRGDPFQRMMGLQNGSPVTLDIWAYIEGPRELEQAFHRAFAPLQFRGEWFWMEGKLLDLLGYLDAPPDEQPRPREAVLNAMSDVIFATESGHPSITDEKYLASCEPHHLAPWFPEVWQ